MVAACVRQFMDENGRSTFPCTLLNLPSIGESGGSNFRFTSTPPDFDEAVKANTGGK